MVLCGFVLYFRSWRILLGRVEGVGIMWLRSLKRFKTSRWFDNLKNLRVLFKERYDRRIEIRSGKQW